MRRLKAGLEKRFTAIDLRVIAWMHRHGLGLLRYSVAAVFIIFGIAKPLGLSPASELVAHTVYWFDPTWFVPFLGWWEVAIGVCLLHRKLLRAGIALMALQMVGTFLPFILHPEVTFTSNPFFLSIEGQYIVKNIVIIAAAVVIGSHVRD